MKKTTACIGLVLGLGLQGAVLAQIGGNGADGVLHPTADLVIDTTNRPGGFDYKSIDIPTGVTVSLIGTHPAILRSQGRVTITGTLHADGSLAAGTTGGAPGAGGYAGGNGGRGTGGTGKGPGGGLGGAAAFGGVSYGQSGRHRPGSRPGYGSAWPFDLRGGSGAGGTAYPVSWQQTGPGGPGGGGTIVILADGKVDVSGSVTALGGTTLINGGAAGSIMIRSILGMTVSGLIDVESKGLFGVAGHGFIRLDSYGDKPTVTGQLKPQAKVLWMPMLREATPVTIGQNWRLEVGGIPGENILLFASPKWTHINLPPLGILSIDPSVMFPLGSANIASTGHDPVAVLSLPVPNDPTLRGVWIYAQGINPTTAHPAGPKLTNHIAVQVQ